MGKGRDNVAQVGFNYPYTGGLFPIQLALFDLCQIGLNQCYAGRCYTAALFGYLTELGFNPS